MKRCDVAELLGRSQASCSAQAYLMGLKKAKGGKPQPKPAAKPIDVNELLRRGISPQTVALITRGSR